MIGTDISVIYFGAIFLGILHGAEPGHGWPIAATYALNRSNKWLQGLYASILLGLGHLVSSLTVVGVVFLAQSYVDITKFNSPLTIGNYQIGGPIEIFAGILLIGLGIREYRKSKPDNHTHGHTHDHDHDHTHEHPTTIRGRIRDALPFSDTHEHPSTEDLDTKGLTGIVWTAFVLGFVHEEEFEIIGLCIGSQNCLELMTVYALSVLLALVSLTLLLIAGYYRYEERVEKFTDYFPAISASILTLIGFGFVLGLI